jgi:hypothetical protein
MEEDFIGNEGPQWTVAFDREREREKREKEEFVVVFIFY